MSPFAAPPGWPRGVRAPGLPGWERGAGGWLLDVCPPEYRSYPVLRRHLVVLARLAVLHTEASQAAVDRGLSEARARFAGVLEPATLDATVETLHRESARLLAQRRAVGLVEDAVRGQRFSPRLAD